MKRRTAADTGPACHHAGLRVGERTNNLLKSTTALIKGLKRSRKKKKMKK